MTFECEQRQNRRARGGRPAGDPPVLLARPPAARSHPACSCARGCCLCPATSAQRLRHRCLRHPATWHSPRCAGGCEIRPNATDPAAPARLTFHVAAAAAVSVHRRARRGLPGISPALGVWHPVGVGRCSSVRPLPTPRGDHTVDDGRHCPSPLVIFFACVAAADPLSPSPPPPPHPFFLPPHPPLPQLPPPAPSTVSLARRAPGAVAAPPWAFPRTPS